MMKEIVDWSKISFTLDSRKFFSDYILFFGDDNGVVRYVFVYKTHRTYPHTVPNLQSRTDNATVRPNFYIFSYSYWITTIKIYTNGCILPNDEIFINYYIVSNDDSIGVSNEQAFPNPSIDHHLGVMFFRYFSMYLSGFRFNNPVFFII